MHVLVIEDEPRILEFLVGALRGEGLTVQPCETFEQAQELLEPFAPCFDTIILDRMLHGKDGAALIPAIKKRSSSSSILVLSAINTPEEKASVLDLGADDYLAKPFSFLELSARLRVLGRRSQGKDGTLLKFKGGQIDLVSHEVTVHGRKIDLSAREYQLLILFLRQPGRVYNRFQLLDQVWNAQFEIESNVVEVTINNLRRKLEGASCDSRILSKRNVGYWIES